MRSLFLVSLVLVSCASKDPVLQPAVIEKVDCTFNFAEFKAPLDVNSKGYRSAEQELRDEVEKTVTQRAVLRSGEEVFFKGGGCAHLSYSFTYSNLKNNKKDMKSVVRTATSLLERTALVGKSKDPLIAALKRAQKVDAREIVEGQYELDCGDANCSLDSRKSGVIQINYDFAL